MQERSINVKEERDYEKSRAQGGQNLCSARPFRHDGDAAIGKQETGTTKFWMGMSHFLPGGGAEWAYEDNPLEKVYFVLDGEVTVKSKTEEFVLRKYDALYLGPNEGRELKNYTNLPATMLVVINTPE